MNYRYGQLRNIGHIATNEDPKKQKATDELVDAIGHSHDILLRATTVFPFTLFPDTLTIDRTKITITHRDFLAAGDVISIGIEDVLNVAATVGPVFGSVNIATRFFDQDKPYKIDHFWRKDALKIKRIAQGYTIARQKEIDTSALSTQELAKTLDELGKVSAEDTI